MSKQEIKLSELVMGKVYSVKWKYKGKEFQDSMVYHGNSGKQYYFKDDRGDFLEATEKMIISITK